MSLALGTVQPGHQEVVLIDIGPSVLPASLLIVADAATGATTYQAVEHVEVTDGGILESRSSTYRLTRTTAPISAAGQAGVDATRPPDGRLLGSPAGSSILVEPLRTKTATEADVYAEHASPIELDDGPWDCDGSSWPTQTWVDITSAPDDALVTGYLIHLDVTHPQMSDLQIGFQQFYGFANFLWNRGDGVDLHRDYTRDYYNQPLDGIGQPVNNLYLILARDCVLGNFGSLDYWSIRIYYDAPDAIDLVAQDLTLTPGTVEPGDDVSVTFSGEVDGTGTVGGDFSIGLYLSTDATVTTDDVLLDQLTETSASNPGDSFGVSGRSVTIPASTADGTYRLGVIIDDQGEITESDETNNVASAALTVDSGGGGGCVPGSHAMCLNDDRFRVEVTWETVGGDTGAGTVVPYGSEDSGLFWFFDPDNWEMMVKVLDGCAINNHYWVFAAATTNVGYTLTVTDTATSEIAVYTNPVGVSSPAVTDASALMTCP
jgi:hypothetical protein